MGALRLAAIWLSPALVLGLADHVYVGAYAALPLALLVVLAPCAAVLWVPREPAAADPNLFTVLLTVLGVIVLLAANLLLVGDIATGLGALRWHTVLVAAGCAFAVTVWPWADRWWPWLGPVALAALMVVLVLVARFSGTGPGAAWNEVASRPAFQFSARSPWVAPGGTFPAAGTLRFAEPHTVRAPDGGLFGLIVSDGVVSAVQEWRPAAGDTLTVRPGDRIVYPPGGRLAFERDRRVPGAPRSGATWADPASRTPALAQIATVAGLAVTLVIGGAALLWPWARLGPGGAVTALALLLGGLGWAQTWAIYAAFQAPELFILSARSGSLVQLPRFALGEPWGSRLGGLVMAALIGLFVATASALRERLAALDRGGGDLGRDAALWAGVFGVAVVASLWPRDPWSVLLTAFGLLASSLGPLAIASPRAGPRGQVIAGALGLAGFALAAFAGPALVGTWAAPFADYPALIGSPAAWATLWLARPRGA